MRLYEKEKLSTKKKKKKEKRTKCNTKLSKKYAQKPGHGEGGNYKEERRILSHEKKRIESMES